MADESYMLKAIEKAREGVKKGQLPFGACIAKGGKIMACAYNTILQDRDLTAHAEMNAIREACRELDTLDLSGCTIYCTCEPCPMCLGALGLANVENIVYGARICDVKMENYTVLDTPPELVRLIAGGRISARGNVLREECIALFRDWEKYNY